jgi:uncharacterized protein YbdZ (MbtH family)
MGTDIHGYIEFRLVDTLQYWRGVINIGPMAERYYHLFGYLFGVRGPGDKFLPVAPGRGMPPYVAEETELAFQSCEGEEATWIGWREFRDAIAAGQSIHAYQQSKNGELQAIEKQWSQARPDYFSAIEQDQLKQGLGIKKDRYLYRYEEDGPLPLGPGWQLIVELGDRLAQHYGEERVRLVVWFAS